jgi:glycosyltransferase involved in cell wall biosynthesis
MAREHDRPEGSPAITAVLCTYNRADSLGDAVGAILAQEGCAFELVVVDDGSADDTPAVLAAIDDPRLRVVRRSNGGLSLARNSGLRAARAPWIVFIDDDDRAEPGWLASLVGQTSDPTVGIACCGATIVKADGGVLWIHHPVPFGEPFLSRYGSVVGSYLAGTFAARTDLVRAAGGYLDGLGTRHQTELFIRMLAVARDWGLHVTYEDAPLVRIEARTPTDRPGVNPRRLYDGTRWILARHPDTFGEQRNVVALFEGIAGTNAARLDDWRSARRRLRRATRLTPRSPGAWGRLALAWVPPVGRQVWNRHGTWSTHNTREVGVLDQTIPIEGAPERELFLAWGYKENPPCGGDGDTHTDPPSLPLLARISRLARRRRSGEITECRAAIERADDPVGLLRRLAERAGSGLVLLSTPDRAVSDPDRPLGPPTNPQHRREWTFDQFELLLLSTGFDVERSWPARGDRTTMTFLVRAGRGQERRPAPRGARAR